MKNVFGFIIKELETKESDAMFGLTSFTCPNKIYLHQLVCLAHQRLYFRHFLSLTCCFEIVNFFVQKVSGNNLRLVIT
jgi:hypothetical protein